MAVRSSGGSGVTSAGATSGGFGAAAPLLEPGTVLADRYEIQAVLGEGGMGAVYRAHDRTLDRTVALKTIRPEMAASPDILTRFKQEVLLASRITHRNVIRLYDLGEASGIKFITMEYIEGNDLRSLLLDKGKFLPADAVETVRQVCQALEAAHSQGVIHRDLKPQNVMRERETSRIVVMDFGLARTVGFDGMTQTGALVGTMEYMSPEQAMAKDVDQRSDIFAVGLIFYELLTGKMPYKADSALASLLKRSQERAVAASDADNSVPRPLSNIVARCLEREPKGRYQSVTELLAELDRHVQVVPIRVSLRPWIPRPRTWKQGVVLAVIGLVLVATGVLLRQRWTAQVQREVAAGPSVSVAIVPLRNASGDPGMDWLGSSVADMLGTDIGTSAQLRTVSSDRMHQIMQDLRIAPGSSLDDSTLRRLAGFGNADILISGQYVKLAARIRLDLVLQDLKNDRVISIRAEAANENAIVSAVDQLAQQVRSNLALSPDAVKKLQASAFKPSTGSMIALRQYNEGLDFLRQGKNQEAQKSLEASAKADPQFALAYSKLAQAYANLGYGDQAEQASRRAVGLSSSLPPAERFQIAAEHARILKDFPKAIEAYEKLAAVAPQDTDIQYALARLYEDSRALDKARAHYDRLLARDPKFADGLLGMARVGIFAGDAQSSLEYLNRALTLAVQVNNAEQKGTALYLLGVAYSLLGQPADALRNYQEALELRRVANDKGGTAQVLNSMAQVQQDLGQSDQALKNYQEALRLRREIADKPGIGKTLLDLGNFYESRGEYDQALDLTKQALQIQRDVGDSKNEATCLNNVGWFYLDKADYDNAMTYFQQALDLRSKIGDQSAIADTTYNLAETSSRMGQYDGALKYYMRALELWRNANDRRGLATADFGMSTLFSYQGRYGAALNAAADALKNFQEAGEKGLWLAQAQGGYGRALSEEGRDAEAAKYLQQALQTAGPVKNGGLTAHLLNLEGQRLFYRGDYKSAAVSFQQALTAASRAKDGEDVLVARLGLATVAVKDGRAGEGIKTLRQLGDETGARGLKYLSAESAICLAEALITTGDQAAARQVLDRAIATSEKLNLGALLARGHDLLATALRAAGDRQEAVRHSDEARRLLDDIRKEAGTEDVLKRSDLAVIAAASKH